MSNIMIDLETMGTGSNAAILALGVVKFNTKGLGDEFYAIIDLNTSVKAGLSIDPSTIYWWLKQSDEARAALGRENESLFSALKAFSAFVGDKDKAKIWGNGASFDNPILADAYRAVNLEQPWKFWNDMCYRTVKNLLGNNIEYVFEGDKHNALDDAKSQALHLIKILTVMGGK